MNHTREKLLEKYAKIFRHHHEPSKDWMLPIAYGLEVGNGWLPLIDDLCMQIQHHVDWKKKSDPEYPQVEVQQCKEKFGGLRFYVMGADEFVSGLICMAEVMSMRICEGCGSPAQTRTDGWHRTTCDICEEKRKSKKSKSVTNEENAGE